MASEDDTLVGDGEESTANTGPGEAPGLRLTRGDGIDRYVVLEPIGRGAMGVVYVAYDPDLDRRVALKLLHRASEDANERLLREARAMAKLSHPNVVAVHDVGEHEGLVWVAMELVDGCNLRQWSQACERTWGECVAVFRKAGEGLAAAHAAGLVHRDFKPDNVLVSREGRVLVTDFGLARSSEPTTAASPVLGNSLDESPQLTRTGTLTGTPAYMAPEQFAGEPAAPASDQFAFCVALYEAVYGQRPFLADSLPELTARVMAGTFAPPANVRVPGWLRTALQRGLTVDPDARFVSMRALLSALDRSRAPGRRGIALLGGAVVLTGALAIATRSAAGPSCDGGDDRLATVWDPARAETMSEAFAATAVPYAPATFVHVRDALDGWGHTWSAAHRQTCEATHVRGEQSPTRLDARMRCLSGQLRRVGALVDELATVDAALVARAETAVDTLPDPAACEDPDASDAIEDPQLRARIDAADDRYAVAEARNITGRYQTGVEAAQAALAALADAEVADRVKILVLLGQLQHRAGDHDTAVETLRRALKAEATTPNPYSGAEAWLELVMVVGDTLARTDEARTLLFPAELAVESADDDALRRRFHSVAGSVLQAGADLEPALAHLEIAIELAEHDEHADDDTRSVLYGNYGNALFDAGRYDEARDASQRALDYAREAHGDSHPAVATSMANLGRVLAAAGEYDEARRLYEDALRMRVRLLGPRHRRVAESELNLSVLLGDIGEHEAARDHAEVALSIWSETLDPDHPYLAIVHNNLGAIENNLGDDTAALEHYRTAEALARKRHGDEHIAVATPLANQANILSDRGELEAALAIYDQVIAMRTKLQGADHPSLAYALVGRARVRLRLGRPGPALQDAEQARAIREAAGVGGPAELYLTYVTLAQALAAIGDDIDGAHAWADKARVEFARTGLDDAAAVELHAFDREHPRPRRG